jgi:hypothetical protein
MLLPVGDYLAPSSSLRMLSRSWLTENRSHVMTDDQSASLVCLGVRHPSVAHDQIFVTVRQLRLWCGGPSLMRGWVCSLQLLLILASTVILRFETYPTTKARSLYLYPREQSGPVIPPDTGFHFYSLTLRSIVEVFEPSHSLSTYTIEAEVVATGGQLVNLSWCQAPIWGPWPDFYYCWTVAGFLMWITLFDERVGL